MTKEKQVAEEILAAAGGKENIAAWTHCMTRLRLTLVNQEQVSTEQLEKINGVLGVTKTAGQFHIILGPGFVVKVAGEVGALVAPQPTVRDLKTEIKAKHQTPLQPLLRRLSNIFVPLIPAVVGSGMVAGLTNIAVQAGADPAGNFIAILNVIGWGLFSYLGIFVGINTARECGGSPALGGLAGVLILNPAIASITIGGISLVPGRGGLIGILLVAWFICQMERNLRRFIPHALDIVLTPTLSLLSTGFVTYYLLQPLGGFLSDAILSFFREVLQMGGALAGYILAGTFLPVVMTGLHQGLLPVHLEFLSSQKENPLLPILAMAGGGQVGAACAVYLKTKNNKLKELIKGALPVGFLGIAEPLIFGVTLPLGRPFLTACLGSGFGGAFQATMHVSSVALGISGLPLAFIIRPGQVGYYLTGLLIAYLAGFIITWLAGFNDPPETESPSANERGE